MMENVEAAYPLSHTQSGMLYHSIVSTDTGVYVTQVESRIYGSVDAGRLELAWQTLVGRHEALRTGFLWDGLDEPLQVVRATVDLRFENHDWSHISPSSVQSRLEEFLGLDRRLGFELDRAPLLRIHLVRLSPQSHILVWTFHHIICDGWSSSILLEEVLSIYHGAEIEAAPRPYREYIDWLISRDRSEDTQYWERRLGDFDEPLAMPTSSPDEQSGVSQVKHVLSGKLSEQIRQLAVKSRISLGSVFHAAWGILLSRYCDTDDVLFGSTFAGRPSDLPSIESMVGLFINTLPVRLAAQDSLSIIDFLHHTQEALLGAQEHQFVSLADIQRLTSVDYGRPLFSTILVFENTPISFTKRDGLTLEDLTYRDQSNFPLAVLVAPEKELSLTIVFSNKEYTAHAAARIQAHLCEVLKAFVRDANASIEDIELLTEPETSQIAEWNDTSVEMPFRGVVDVLNDNLSSWPDRIALIDAEGQTTYHELNARSNEIAARLVSMGVQAGDRVGLLLPRSRNAIVAMIAVLRIRAAYVPIDPNYPESRVAYMISDAKCSTLIVDDETNAFPFNTESVLNVCSSDPDNSLTPIESLVPSATDVAYIMYTSGSTGSPKGVVITHDNLYSSTTARLRRYEDIPERFLLLSSLSFDSSVAGIYWTLCAGGTIVIPGPRAEQDMVELGTAIERERVTHLLCLPTLYRMLLDFCNPGTLSSLKVVIVAGESCHADIGERHLEILPGARLFNEYGPTEATVWASVYELQDAISDNCDIPIGTPIPNTRLHVLDRRGRRMPIGVPGELYIAGRGVSSGYLDRPAESALSFVRYPRIDQEPLYRTGDIVRLLPSGDFEFLGRVDDQLKIRGVRIEPGEIESAIREHPMVRDVAIASIPGPGHRKANVDIPSVDDILRALAPFGMDASREIVEEVERSISHE